MYYMYAHKSICPNDANTGLIYSQGWGISHRHWYTITPLNTDTHVLRSGILRNLEILQFMHLFKKKICTEMRTEGFFFF